MTNNGNGRLRNGWQLKIWYHVEVNHMWGTIRVGCWRVTLKHVILHVRKMKDVKSSWTGLNPTKVTVVPKQTMVVLVLKEIWTIDSTWTNDSVHLEPVCMISVSRDIPGTRDLRSAYNFLVFLICIHIKNYVVFQLTEMSRLSGIPVKNKRDPGKARWIFVHVNMKRWDIPVNRDRMDWTAHIINR